MPLAGGTPEQVTRGPNNEFVNDWSPDGEELVYHSMNQGGQRDVMVVSADGMKTEAVAEPGEEQHGAGDGWQQASSRVSVGGATTSVHVEAGAARRRVAAGAPAGRGQLDPKWSRDA